MNTNVPKAREARGSEKEIDHFPPPDLPLTPQQENEDQPRPLDPATSSKPSLQRQPEAQSLGEKKTLQRRPEAQSLGEKKKVLQRKPEAQSLGGTAKWGKIEKEVLSSKGGGLRNLDKYRQVDGLFSGHGDPGLAVALFHDKNTARLPTPMLKGDIGERMKKTGESFVTAQPDLAGVHSTLLFPSTTERSPPVALPTEVYEYPSQLVQNRLRRRATGVQVTTNTHGQFKGSCSW